MQNSSGYDDEPKFVPKRLTGLSMKFVQIPKDVIDYPDTRLVIAFSFFAIKCGMDDRVDFTIESFVRWCGYEPNSHKGKINDKFIESIKTLAYMGYVTVNGAIEQKSKNEFVSVTVNTDYIHQQLNENRIGFAIIYLDEIQKIFEYNIPEEDRYFNTDILLLTLAFMRTHIIYRGEYADPIENPEVFQAYYSEISQELHINPKTFSKAITILDKDLDIIYVRHIRKKIGTDKWVTLPTLFCNKYKRDTKRKDKCEIAYGDGYYYWEVKNKCNILKVDFGNSKTKIKKTGEYKYEDDLDVEYW